MKQSLTRHISYFARVNYRDDNRLFGIYQKDRLFGMYLLGKTGAGKTNLMHVLMNDDVRSYRGFCLFDANGDVIKTIRKDIPVHRLHDVINLDVSNQKLTWGYNPLRRVPYHVRPLIASSLLETFQKHWGNQAWGVRLEYLLRNTLLTLLDQTKSSFHDIPRLLLDEGYRASCIPHIINPHVKRFWEREFP